MAGIGITFAKLDLQLSSLQAKFSSQLQGLKFHARNVEDLKFKNKIYHKESDDYLVLCKNEIQ